MDSDLQDDPAAIGRMVECVARGLRRGVCGAGQAEGSDLEAAACSPRSIACWPRVSSTPIPADAGNFSLIDARAVRANRGPGRARSLPARVALRGSDFASKESRSERDPRYDAQPRVSLRGLWRLAKTAIFSFSSLPLGRIHIFLAMRRWRCSSGWAAIRSFAGCLPTWRFPAGLRTFSARVSSAR